MTTVDSAGVNVHYEVVGHGPPIVLVHGFTLSFETNWRTSRWVDFLVEAGRQVVGVDCRGHGESDKPHDPALYSGNQMPDDVLAVMDRLRLERADIMGYSMGGWITLNLLSRHPSRFTSAVAGGAGLVSRAFDPVLRAAVAAALETDDPSSIVNETARNMRRLAESGANDLHALAAMQHAERAPPDNAALAHLNLPVLVVVGDQDPVLSSARQLAGTVPNAALELIPGADHLEAIASTVYKDAVAAFLGHASPVRSAF
jgi:pimeloyl-ACP methyl ester carboxylesterase